jgi:hypothetical protein
MLRALVALSILAFSAAYGFQADLVPVRIGPATEDLEGSVAINGEDGHIRVLVEGLNDEKNEPLDGTATLQLRLRVDGRSRRVSLPVVLDTGDGQAETSLNLVPGARIAVKGIRLRAPNGRTLATAGMVVVSGVAPTTTTTLPPNPDDCPAGLAACQEALAATQVDLAQCVEDLDICEEAL